MNSYHRFHKKFQSIRAKMISLFQVTDQEVVAPVPQNDLSNSVESQLQLDTLIEEKIRSFLIRSEKITPQQTPNLDIVNTVFSSADAVHINIKTFGYEYARQLIDQLSIPHDLSPETLNLASRCCQQSDIESSWYWYWCQVMKVPVVYHRKVWEFAYILQALHDNNMLQKGYKGLGFGCGEEPLPSIFSGWDITVTATDLSPLESSAKGWVETNQSMSSKEKIWQPHLCSKEQFDKNVTLEYVDMNAIPSHLYNQYNFCWSSCALEHLGSIKKGLDFIENSLLTLIPGGIAIHTTEYNYLEEEKTIDNWQTVLFRKKDFIEIQERLSKSGHTVQPLNFDIGSGVLDRFIDLPPYSSALFNYGQEAHLRLLVDGFATTSFGLIIQKKV